MVARCDPYKDPIPEIPSEVILETAAVYIRAYETITGQTFPLPEAAENPWSASAATSRLIFGAMERRKPDRDGGGRLDHILVRR